MSRKRQTAPNRSTDPLDYQRVPRAVAAMPKDFASGFEVLPHVHERAQLIYATVGAMRVSEGTELGQALRTLVEDLPGLTVHLALPDALVIDDAARAHCVLRCVQEIVTNTLRHARARNLWIAIEQRAGAITVDARDDGRGAPRVEAGNGLTGMRARIEELGGFLRIAPAPSFSVTAQLPLGGEP